MRTDFDFTMMSSYQTCARKYYYRHVLGRELKKPQVAPDFGKAIHVGLDSWFVDQDLKKAIELFKANFKEQPDISDHHTHRVGEWVLSNYHEKYKDQPFKVLATEQAFTVRLPNGNNLIGRIDKVLEWAKSIWVMDHKTTSQLGAQYFKMADPNMQFTLYTWAARQLGFKAVGVIVDAILVRKSLLDSSQRARLNPLMRLDVYKSEESIKEMLEVVDKVEGDIRVSEETDTWTPNYSACTLYGECPYRRVCVEDKEIRGRVLEMDYQVNHWDPRGVVL